MTKTNEELVAENQALREEIERLQTQTALTMFGALTTAPSSERTTILGLDEMVITVSGDDTVGYVNNPMMKLLDIDDRKAAIGEPLSDFDRGVLGENTLAALVQVARASAETQILERAFPDIPAESLPAVDVPEGAGDPVLRFTAVSRKDRVQIIAQDVTRTRWLENTFSRYVSPKVIEQLQRTAEGDFLAMERCEVTILFGDLRGFTTLCQEASPPVVQETINSFLTNMVECIDQLDGTVQGFVGDEVMAIFGAPMPQDDHALRALICAVEMQRVHQEWTADRTARDEPAPQLGIGLATGNVVVGNIGTISRMDYTAQGHGVNLAARLCGAAKGGEVLTVPETHTAALKRVKAYDGAVVVPRFGFKSMGKLSFKNVTEPVEVLSVVVKGEQVSR
ncbi:MAG: adenylate/guanylate cyclase domain-containing protein [Deltaproteobacteria bacterium]|nr:adenylate/guanylate cyclase domain-containing protein [Deltaproteobacteria bacterium]